MAGYYDVILGLIPLTLIGITGVVSVAGLSLTTAVLVGATVSILLIGHALFINGPVTPESKSATPLRTNSAD
ncbi:hypothetical protein [Haladaptatus caseinilyticus]|uniref:hypothetical protein n=1 Tax=Haladaptatus caseinilyticus TaxID=2993314 RepID=UPI00224A891E|nr:hypothetical protein [Haladaptatus caseinilyticus]